MKIFALFRHVPCYNRVSVTTNIKNSGLLVRIQDDDEENSAARRKLRAILSSVLSKILRLSWTALKKKLMQKDIALKLARFIHIMLRKNVLNSQQ